jgi:hypothetical protein
MGHHFLGTSDMSLTQSLSKIFKLKKLSSGLEKNIFIVSFICLCWLLLRTGRKPYRFVYPCQKIAAAQVVSFGAYLLPFFGIHKFVQWIKHGLLFKIICNNFIKIIIIFIFVGFISVSLNQAIRYKNIKKYDSHRLHEAIGLKTFTALHMVSENMHKGSTHRVVSVYDSMATSWDYETGLHWNYIDQDVVRDMVSKGIMALTGTTNLVDAWTQLIPYQAGEAVAIKVNFNNAWNYEDDDNDHESFPETVNAVIDGLISIGVPIDKIWIIEPSRVVPYRFQDKIYHEGVHYYSGLYIGSRPNQYLTTFVDANSPEASPIQNPPTEIVRPAQVLVDAHHLINIPLMKGHPPDWVTLGLKNHYGSISFQSHERRDMHEYIYPTTADPNSNPLGDINNNPNIRDKTRLVLGDALFGQPLRNWATPPLRWQTFGDDSPNILFFGVDPIATESVMLDYLNAELTLIDGPRNHDYLHYAANLGLGIHEHWDDYETKHYNTIDYVEIGNNNTGVPIDSILHGVPQNLSLLQNYPNPFNHETTIKYYIPTESKVLVRVYNVLGHNVRTLVDEAQREGIHYVDWNGENDLGEQVVSGLYYYEIIAEKYKNIRKMLLIK